jgi:hypothetical protein
MFYVELLNPCYSYSSIQDSQSEEPVENYPQQSQGLFSDVNNNRQTQKGLERLFTNLSKYLESRIRA